MARRRALENNSKSVSLDPENKEGPEKNGMTTCLSCYAIGITLPGRWGFHPIALCFGGIWK